MGQEDERAQRLAAFEGFTVDAALVDRAASDAVVLHCLPAHRGEEITDDVLEGPRSLVWRQAAHRRTAMRGVLAWVVEEDPGERAGPEPADQEPAPAPHHQAARVPAGDQPGAARGAARRAGDRGDPDHGVA